jgi:hypothetical protein
MTVNLHCTCLLAHACILCWHPITTVGPTLVMDESHIQIDGDVLCEHLLGGLHVL